MRCREVFVVNIFIIFQLNETTEGNLLILTRATLGYFYNTLHWGGGGAISSLPLISETTGPNLKIPALEKLSWENKF